MSNPLAFPFQFLHRRLSLRFISTPTTTPTTDTMATETKEYTYQDVAEHNTKKDIFVVIHDKVYDCTKFLDEHP